MATLAAWVSSSEPWWLRLGFEHGDVSEHCPVEGCTAPRPIDVYCPEHSTLLIFQSAPGVRRRWLFANILRVVAIGVVGLGAEWVSAVPIFLVTAVAAAGILLIRLRGYRFARAVAFVAWAAIASFVLLINVLDISAHDRTAVLVCTFLALAVLAWGFLLARGSSYVIDDEELPDEVGRQAVIGVVATVGAAPAALILWWITSDVIDAPDLVNNWLLGAAAGAAVGAVMIAAVASAVRSYKKIDAGVARMFHRRADPQRLDWATRPKSVLERRRSAAIGKQASHLELFALRLQVALASSASGFANIVRLAGTRFLNFIIDIAETFHGALVRSRRRFRMTLEYMGRCLNQALRVLVELGTRALRAVFLPLVGLALAALGAWWCADNLIAYLNDGPLLDAVLAALAGVLVLVGCFLAWAAWANAPIRAALRVEVETLETISPDALLMLVAGGWLLGIAGWLGFGPVRPGPITIGATVLLLAVVLTQWHWGDEEHEVDGAR